MNCNVVAHSLLPIEVILHFLYRAEKRPMRLPQFEQTLTPGTLLLLDTSRGFCGGGCGGGD
ncbi:hypothetical protein OAH23_14155 [Verrucomicrobia bacterium]|nr:hypothetical protein [Verrucomicrobiota bacterium]MDB4691549.1 hypothetical protein [Verrucomicrobiota bacterium]